ncbi:MAG: PocR ligand-binding domain-containing protein [Syntrophobacteria bacterium]
MELTDVLPLEEWLKFEKELHDRFHMNCTIYNANGFSINEVPNWCNRLCPAIKANKNSLAAICAPANQNFMLQAERTRKPVIGECDAGLLKVAVPIFLGDEFLGTAGGCGLLPTGGEVEDFIIQKSSGMDEEKIAELCEGLGTISESEAEAMAQYIARRLDELLAEHAEKQ